VPSENRKKKLMKRLIFTTAIAATLAGCAVPERAAPLQRPLFPEAEYAALESSGTARVTGQVFLKTRSGDVKTGAGNVIYLNPATSYSKFAYEHNRYPGGLTAADARLHGYMQQAVADASGRFTFKNVPAGEYYVTGQVTWEAFSSSAGGLRPQGGAIWKLIAVQEGEIVEVMVTD
jgi:hypothetical protein